MNRLIFSFILLIGCSGLCFADSDTKAQLDQYQKAVSAQSQYHALRTQGNQLLEEGRYSEALIYHEKAFQMVQGTSLEAVSRNKLMILYEKVGDYSKSLEQCQWFLTHSKGDSPLWNDWVKTEKRLLQEIEEQKKEHKMPQASEMSATFLSQSTNLISDFQKADYVSQKKFLEKKLPEDTEIRRLSRQAMLAEHSGKFLEAKGFYEQLLAKKEGVIAEQGEVAWVMLHCAVQRTSEVTGDEAREKEMLAWIRDNMLEEQGSYHKYLDGLLPNVQDHLRERIKKFCL